MKKILFVCFTISFILNLRSQTIITSKSEVQFQITGGGLFKVKGTITGMQGDFHFSKENLQNSKFNICIDATTIDTNNKKRDNHLLREDFFDVEKFPNICFQSNTIKKSEKAFITTGNLTMLGVTKEIEIPFKYENNAFTGEFIVNRFDYGLGKDYGTFKVGKESKIKIICVVN